MKQRDVWVIKCNHTGRPVWKYKARLLERTSSTMTVEAPFMREDIDADYFVFQQNDRFVEFFFSNSWYNIFEIHDRDDDHLRGWYCNICRPAVISGGSVAADDLALDLFVYPDGEMLVLDEDEFDALPLSKDERESALRGLDRLQRMVRNRRSPFHKLPKDTPTARNKKPPAT